VSSGKSAEDCRARRGVVAEAWKNLEGAIRADVACYNAHPKAKRRLEIMASQHPKLIEVRWREGTSSPLISIKWKPREFGFEYSRLSAKSRINPIGENEFTLVGERKQPLRIDAPKLSEELLSPALFP
jgi:hypothetical protein